MEKDYEVVFSEKPEWEIIGGGISAYNKQHAVDDKGKTLCYIIQGTEKEVVGGVIGAIYWDWLYIDLMWIRKDLRGRGYGKQLLKNIEDEARKLGAKNAYLDTFSFQAPNFYKKHGYYFFGELQNFPPGHQRYFLTKKL